MLSMKWAAALAAAVLVVAACGGGTDPEPEAPELIEEVEAPAESVPDPEPEAPEPEPEAPEPEPDSEPELAAEPEPLCPAGEHRHDDGGVCHPEDPEPEPAREPAPEPVPEPFDEEIEDFDPAEHVPVEPSTDPDAHPCDQVDDADDGALGVCTVDDERFCYALSGWELCPGGGGEPCEPAPEQGAVVASGSTTITDQVPTVELRDGWWLIEVCLWDNDLLNGEPGDFELSLWTPIDDQGQTYYLPVVIEEAVVAGEWSREIEIRTERGPIFEVYGSAVGGGAWAVVFTPLLDAGGDAS